MLIVPKIWPLAGDMKYLFLIDFQLREYCCYYESMKLSMREGIRVTHEQGVSPTTPENGPRRNVNANASTCKFCTRMRLKREMNKIKS